VDFKFDGHDFKICEFGEGRRSAFKGMNRLYWDKYWNYLKQFNLPIWHVGEFYLPNEFEEMRATDSLIRCGGAILPSLELLEKCSKFKALVKCPVKDPYKISNYKAIVCTTFMDNRVSEFRQKYPNVLIWDLATAFYVNSKINTVELLSDPEFSKYCPKSKIFKRISTRNVSDYAQRAANEIIEEFQSDYYVIKPANGTMGKGVFIVAKDDLKYILKHTLKLYDKKKEQNQNVDARFKSWVDDKSRLCLIQEFVGSKIIQVNEKFYEPTMRLIFILCYDDHSPKIEILGGYWKIPNISLDQDGDLTKKLKSGTAHETKSEISTEDYLKATQVLKSFMPRLYLKMLNRL
jgi:hypothetical protein